MPNPRIEGTVPEEAGTRSSPLEGRLAALEQRANTLLANLEKERQAVEEQKPEDKPATVGEVQVALDKLMQGVAMASNGLANSVNEIVEGIRNEYATQDQAKQFAKDAVPTALQDLDAASSSPGDTLMRQPGGKGNSDSGYWGLAKSGGINLTGTVLLPHLKWNAEDEEWEIALIVPDGTASTPHLVWVGGAWTAGLIEGVPDGTENGQFLLWDGSSWRPNTLTVNNFLPEGSAGTPHLIWSGGEWIVGLISGLPEGGTQYQVLQRDGSGGAVWDWTR